MIKLYKKRECSVWFDDKRRNTFLMNKNGFRDEILESNFDMYYKTIKKIS